MYYLYYIFCLSFLRSYVTLIFSKFWVCTRRRRRRPTSVFFRFFFFFLILFPNSRLLLGRTRAEPHARIQQLIHAPNVIVAHRVCAHNNNYVSRANARGWRPHRRREVSSVKCVTLETSVPTRGKKLAHAERAPTVCETSCRCHETFVGPFFARNPRGTRFPAGARNVRAKISFLRLSRRVLLSTRGPTARVWTTRCSSCCPSPSPCSSYNIVWHDIVSGGPREMCVSQQVVLSTMRAVDDLCRAATEICMYRSQS